MKIPIERLSVSPTPFAREGDCAWWRAQLAPGGRLPSEPCQPIRVELEAHRMGEDLYLAGAVDGVFELECSRCLKRYRHPLREPFRLALEPAGERLPSDPEAAATLARDGLCLGDDLEAGWFRGSEIDLATLVRETISLALPVKPLCQEACKGLCARCGGNLNEVRCECAELSPESPFAVLAALRDRAKGEEH